MKRRGFPGLLAAPLAVLLGGKRAEANSEVAEELDVVLGEWQTALSNTAWKNEHTASLQMQLASMGNHDEFRP